MEMRGRRVFLENPKHVDVVLEERQLREIAMAAKNRSEFIRDAIDLALGHKDFTEGQKLREENERLRREMEELRRENEELHRQIEEAKKLIEVLKGERKAQGLDAKRYQTSFGWLTAEEIKQLYEKKKPVKPLEWLSSVLYNDAIAIQEVAAVLGLQDSSSSPSSSATAPAAAREKLKDAAVRRRKRLMEEMDFKRLAEEWNCTEEEARRMVEEKLGLSSSSSESASSEEASSLESEELIKRARSIIEGY